MARVETLTYQEEYVCGFCEKTISMENGDTEVAIVGGDGEEWHTVCATRVGYELEEPDDDPDFKYDPDMDGPEEDYEE